MARETNNDNQRSLSLLGRKSQPTGGASTDGGSGIKLPQKSEPTRYLGHPNPNLTGKLHMARTKGGR